MAAKITRTFWKQQVIAVHKGYLKLTCLAGNQIRRLLSSAQRATRAESSPCRHRQDSCPTPRGEDIPSGITSFDLPGRLEARCVVPSGCHLGRRSRCDDLRWAEEGGWPIEAGRLPLPAGAVSRGAAGQEGAEAASRSVWHDPVRFARKGSSLRGHLARAGVQGTRVGSRTLDHSQAGRVSRTRFEGHGRRLGLGRRPPFALNDHCPVCEFRQRCHEQAVKEDNLSLLRGMGEKEVKGLARKGILTLTQLAHTSGLIASKGRERFGRRTTATTPCRLWPSAINASTSSARPNSQTAR